MANFEWFRSFLAIYRQGSISAAASVRYMTQPALSQHLAALEAEVGEPLFRRAPRQMIPTERGKALYAQIVQAVDRLERTTTEFQDSEIRPALRIGGSPEFIHEWLLPRLGDAPYQLTFAFGQTKPLLQALRDNEIDVLIASQQFATAGLVFTKLTEEKFLLVGNQPIAGLDDLELNLVQAQLEKQAWISYAAENPIIRRFWFQAFGVRNTIRANMIVPDLRIIKTLVLQGRGISVLPEYLVQAELEQGTLHELWSPRENVANDLWLAYPSSAREDMLFMNFVEDLVNNEKKA
jgi:DNA-binding transcriptional LysR family regulator